MSLDAFDKALLEVVQQNNRLPNREIAERVCLSETAVRRRLDRLRADGIITGDVALLDRNSVAETLIVAVTFKDDQTDIYQRFLERMKADPTVSQIYSIAGSIDFILHVHAANLSSYEAWAERQLLADPGIKRYETSVVFTTIKYETQIPV